MRRAKAASLRARSRRVRDQWETAARTEQTWSQPTPPDTPRPTQLCPHPFKRGYSTIRQAELADPGSFNNPHFNLYKCRCGAFHYGHTIESRNR